ncbi:hypothetical protein [Pseudonocardia kongjuensis]|uniref:hypothetical protein n=1 Tax=Pseudonocardia kongjuensis TaxID=102227 RepID=UPI0031E0998A
MSAPTLPRPTTRPAGTVRALQVPGPVAPMVLAADAARSGFGIRRPLRGQQVMPCTGCGQMMAAAAMRWLPGPRMGIGCARCATGSAGAR